MWKVFVLSQEMGVRPSEVLGIANDYVAYCIDEVVVLFGLEIRAELDKVGVKQSSKDKRVAAQRKTKLEALLTPHEERRYATPVATK